MVNQAIPLSRGILVEDNRWLSHDTTEEEILQVVCQINPLEKWDLMICMQFSIKENVDTPLVRTLALLLKGFYNLFTCLRKLIKHIFFNS